MSDGCGAPVQADDLQNNLFFRLRQRTLLKRQLNQLLVIRIRERSLRAEIFRNHGFENG